MVIEKLSKEGKDLVDCGSQEICRLAVSLSPESHRKCFFELIVLPLLPQHDWSPHQSGICIKLVFFFMQLSLLVRCNIISLTCVMLPCIAARSLNKFGTACELLDVCLSLDWLAKFIIGNFGLLDETLEIPCIH